MQNHKTVGGWVKEKKIKLKIKQIGNDIAASYKCSKEILENEWRDKIKTKNLKVKIKKKLQYIVKKYVVRHT